MSIKLTGSNKLFVCPLDVLLCPLDVLLCPLDVLNVLYCHQPVPCALLT